MKRSDLLTLVAFLLVTFSGGMILMHHYRPAVASLARTTTVSGKLHFTQTAVSVPEVEDVLLKCGMDFLAEHDPCQQRVPALRAGALLTVTTVTLPVAMGSVQLTTSIQQDGQLVYVRTPEQVVHDYARRSWKVALFMPGVFLLVLLCEMIGALRSNRLNQ